MNLLSKAIPLLNKYVPSALAVKGLSKIDSRLGTFIQNAISSGYTTDTVLDFLRSSIQSPGDKREMQNLESMSASGNIHPEQQRSLQKRQGEEAIGKGISTVAGLSGGLSGLGSETQPGAMNQASQMPEMSNENTLQSQAQPPSIPSKENRNIIQQYSPELFEFLQEQIQKGNNPIAAGAAAQNNSKFSNIIKKISKDHKADWSSILQTVFGNEQAQQAPQQQNTQQQGPGSEILMKALQMAAEARKRRQ